MLEISRRIHLFGLLLGVFCVYLTLKCFAVSRWLHQLLDEKFGRCVIALSVGVFIYGVILVMWRGGAARAEAAQLRHRDATRPGARLGRWHRALDSVEPAQRRTMLDEVMERELAIVQRSYALPQLFIWVLPILGLIGTVEGISVAMQQFRNGMAAQGGISTSIQSVTNGMASAFLTTMITLSLSIPLMFLATLHLRHEEANMDACREALLPQVLVTPGSPLCDGATLDSLIGANDKLSSEVARLSRLLTELRDEELS